MTVIIEYPEYDESAARLVQKIKRLDVQLCADADGKQVRIGLSDVYYVENVDRKLFLYTQKDVYRFDATMAEVQELAADTDLVRISRTCIMNADYLKEIRQVRNSRLEAILDNGETLIVSRKYLKDIKKVFRRG